MILSQRYPEVFDGIISGDPAMRTGLSNLAIGRWIPIAFNQVAPKDANGKPIIEQSISDNDRKLIKDGAHESVRRERWSRRWNDLRSSRVRFRS